ncbi:(2Fe-2S)-binding protein [Saccharopolyspora flava]|uniref:Carbon-monoxide dehydrogenase small subunit n=1 Tax=Saccharopolyspora flava TaxID=95161 RepID=A0A1I6SZJ6_9PSEU|nr:(2Fe-2S)-binding protein [Saccharopolyspora flava]SFS82283.1 carbon-monoxide dehydrogenase small subunit [Saccharopolyspora flava]
MPDVPSPTRDITVTVNGRTHHRTVPVRRLLVDFLREDLALTGTHIGCEHGVCGACTILVDGEPARSCITLAVQADGCEITTVEGLTPDDGLTPMQQAFTDHHALQCGFCTPGILLTLAAADPEDHPTDADVRTLLSGNLCRCTGYQHIIDAVNQAWDR